GGVTQSLAGTLTGGGSFAVYATNNRQATGTYTDQSLETFSATATSQGSYSLYKAGSYGGTGYNYGSFLYQQSSSGSYSLTDLHTDTQTGAGLATATSLGTTTDGAHTGTASGNDAGTFSYTLTSQATLTANGSSSASDYLAGQFANGSYSLSSFVHDDQSGDSM